MRNERLWRRCVDAARQAPSKHNVQPWWFDLYADHVELHADGARAMPASDPAGRELVIGCGAALYNFCLALRCAGHEPDLVLFPRGDGLSLVARIGLAGPHVPTGEEQDLLDAIPKRHTNRNPLDATLMAPSVPFLLQRAAEPHGVSLRLVTSVGDQQTLDNLIAHADRIAVRDPEIESELIAWVRPEGDPATDGVPARAAGRGSAAAYRARFVQRDFDLYGELPGGHEITGDADRPLPAILGTPGDRPVDWLRAGLALEAVLLTATVAGAAASFLNQPLERPDLRAALRRDLDLAEYPQLLLRLGVGGNAAPTPRRPIDEIVVRP